MKAEKGKIKIRKIDNKAARQVAFSKRRRGLFSKAEQLSQLCDANVAAIIFSTAGRPYSYSSSSIKDIIAKYEMTSKKSLKQDHESEVLNKQYATLCEEVAKKGHELRQLKGEGLEVLEIEQLQGLEDKIEATLKRLRKNMEEMCFMAEIKSLHHKQAELLQENDRLRQMIMMESQDQEEAADHPQETTGINGTQEVGHPRTWPNNNNSDSSVTLKLGLPCSDD